MDNNRLKLLCESIGIKTVGVAGVDRSENLKNILEYRSLNNLNTGLEEPDIEKRINPKLIMENAKSIIVCAFPYYTGEFTNSNISKYCYGKDYHIVIRSMLTRLCELINQELGDFEYKVFVDNGPLVDRYLAYLSGIGYFGINNSIITDEFGSYVFIGYIINNYEFAVDKPMKKSCINCGKCIDYCPGNAILGNYKVNPTKCLSHITQKKGELSEEEKNIIKKTGTVFGCDVCQDICPHNTSSIKTNIEEFKKNLIVNLNYEDLNKISNKEFKRTYGDRAFSWRGKKILVRNMEILSEK
ncbi:tRNA epoxyqueuosine(34) reductase QueG [Clostridioides mangenotii]|uniref:tRNA epoxyqueuosine(34) reductase QueG n=1 Tax=Metaclostridioides mangenotii TaxID=1540 RepID=UPI00214A4F15|nr:tRNA epoxyqueuosine(34) reductase QueG [Clostridioides mangenotii]MCR1954031.1 tRNA epoxyqueuosine(34) reductase QueG [Clostridioides mangenotii]